MVNSTALLSFAGVLSSTNGKSSSTLASAGEYSALFFQAPEHEAAEEHLLHKRREQHDDQRRHARGGGHLRGDGHVVQVRAAVKKHIAHAEYELVRAVEDEKTQQHR